MTTEPETLAQLYRQTAEVYAALANNPNTPHEASDDGDEWHSDLPGALWRFRRIKPPEKTPEQLRVEANLRLKEELKDPTLAQWRCPRDGFFEWTNQVDWNGIDDPAVEFRRKPAPVYVPWAFEDQLCGKVVEHKTTEHRGVITFQWPDLVRVAGGGNQDYADLLREWTCDGKPCGKEQG